MGRIFGVAPGSIFWRSVTAIRQYPGATLPHLKTHPKKVSLLELTGICYKTGMSLEKREFLIRGEDGKEYGPAGLEELREWVRENRAGMGSFVRLDESGAIWEPWQHYPELVALAAEAQATGPTPGAAGLTIAPLTRRVLAGVADVILSYILALPIIVVVLIV